MSGVVTWREKQAARPDPIAAALEAWHRTDTDDRTRMVDAIEAYETALTVARECDEPGCTAEASCGWPVLIGGYRRTCSGHRL